MSISLKKRILRQISNQSQQQATSSKSGDDSSTDVTTSPEPQALQELEESKQYNSSRSEHILTTSFFIQTYGDFCHCERGTTRVNHPNLVGRGVWASHSPCMEGPGVCEVRGGLVFRTRFTLTEHSCLIHSANAHTFSPLKNQTAPDSQKRVSKECAHQHKGSQQ